jgi:hypothetical protein
MYNNKCKSEILVIIKVECMEDFVQDVAFILIKY